MVASRCCGEVGTERCSQALGSGTLPLTQLQTQHFDRTPAPLNLVHLLLCSAPCVLHTSPLVSACRSVTTMALLARQSRARLGCLKQQVLTTTVRGMSTKPDKTLHLVRAAGMPILQQLRLEEALLRNDDRNWCALLCCARRGGSYWLMLTRVVAAGAF